MGIFFGPIMALWFTTLGVLEVSGIVENPAVMRAFHSIYAVEFFAQQGISGIVVLGAVFLAVTGGEALHADMGHLGMRPIRDWAGSSDSGDRARLRRRADAEREHLPVPAMRGECPRSSSRTSVTIN